MAAAPPKSVFVSHTSKNDPFVAALRPRLEARGYTVLEDSQFVPGDNLPDDVRRSIDRAECVVAVGSTEAKGSHWVKRELRYARKQGKRIIPLLLPGSSTAELREILELPQPKSPDADLEDWPPELIGIRVPVGAGGLDALMPGLLDALEGRGGGGTVDLGPPRPAVPLADLVLRLRATRFELVKNPAGADVRRPVATATLAYYAPGATDPTAESQEFSFVAPLGKIEAGELRFYLEKYFITPFGVFAEKARGIEKRLPEWGQDLWDALDPTKAGLSAPVKQWQAQAAKCDRRFTIQAPPARILRDSATGDQKTAWRADLEAVTELLGLPWELLHDGRGYLFHDGIGVRVRRSLPGGDSPADLDEAARKPPLRVLIVCARPDDERATYIDHRVSVQPLVEALNRLGELAEYDILSPPTFQALCDRLHTALEKGRPYHIVHFDGHGVFDKATGLGALVFEHPEDAAAGKLHHRRSHIVGAGELGAKLRHAGVGLFFLEACQSAQAEQNPEASVAGRLLQCGVGSVVAMSHSVLVETARQFTAVFYPALVEGKRVGSAMLLGQRALEQKRQRGWGWEPRGDEPGKVHRTPLELQDWFVPVLYQDGLDPVLLATAPPSARVQQELQKDRALAVGDVPAAPPHAFVGRSRLLLAAERLMLEAGEKFVVLRGEGGEGKTTLAAELARWLVATRRADRAAFASVENLPAEGTRAVLSQWGGQLAPDFAAKADTTEHARNALVELLRSRDVVLVLDNVESILPPPKDSEAAAARVYEPELVKEVFAACTSLLDLAPNTRIVFTSREALPAPFAGSAHLIEVGRLSTEEGMEIVARVLAQGAAEKGGGTVNAEALRAEREEDIQHLVTTVNAHARTLVLLTPELARRGLRATADDLADVMADLERRYPGERERSLYASLELSLRRLPKAVREKLAPLGVMQGGCCLLGLQVLLQVEPDAGFVVASLLAEVGLCEMVGVVKQPTRSSDIFLRFDPALAPVLRRELRARDAAAQHTALSSWALGYARIANLLYIMRAREPHLVARLTLLELPNLLGALRRMSGAPAPAEPESSRLGLAEIPPHAVVEFATSLESMLATLGRHEALAEVVALRERAANRLASHGDRGLTHATYTAASEQAQRFLEAGRLAEAIRCALAMVQECERTPDDAFPELAYDYAHALTLLGRAQQMSGDPRAGLVALGRARDRFEVLAKDMAAAENRDASARMASVCITEQGDCLFSLGKLDDAAACYEEAIQRDRTGKHPRGLATSQGQLGTLRMAQGRYAEALQAHMSARDTFEALREPSMVSIAWHQIGMVHHKAGKHEAAEEAYQRSLAIAVQMGSKSSEAATRNQLGALCRQMAGRTEEAVTFFLRAAEMFADPAIADPLKEGLSRNNAASSLLALGRLEEARSEVQKALKCKAGFGPNAEPWTSLSILYRLEVAAGNAAAAAKARAETIAAYAAARRSGWQITVGGGAELCDLVGAVVAAKSPAASPDGLPTGARAQLLAQEPELRAQLAAVAGDPNAPAYLRPLAPVLLAILDGSRDLALADDPALDYDDAAEVILLLEKL